MFRGITPDDLNAIVRILGSSYVLSASDVGKQMYFEVSFTDDDGFAESVQYLGTQSVVGLYEFESPVYEFNGHYYQVVHSN